MPVHTTRLKRNATILKLMAVCLLAGCFFDIGFEIWSSMHKTVEITYKVHVKPSESMASTLFNSELSEGENETASRYSLQHQSLHDLTSDIVFATRLWRSFAKSSKAKSPQLTATSNLIIRTHQFII